MKSSTEAIVEPVKLGNAEPVVAKHADIASVTVDKAPEEDQGLSALFARYQAKIDAARGEAPAAEPVAEAPAVDEQPAEAEAEAVEAQPEEPAAEGDVVTEPTDEQPAAEAAPETPAEPPVVSFDAERLKLELADARKEVEAVKAQKRTADFDNYFEKPTDAIKQYIADTLGVDVSSPLVKDELRALTSELTFEEISGQDLPEQTQDQLSRDRLNRKIRLDSHRRQSSQRAAQADQQKQLEARARQQAESVYDAVKAQFPDVALAEIAFNRPKGEVIHQALVEAVQTGRIKDWETKSDSELFTEAIRLLNPVLVEWRKQVAPLIAPQPPAPAPVSPGAAKPESPKKNAPSPAAAHKPQNASPRTLPATKAGAAPARPGTPAKPDAHDLPLSSRDRMAAIFAKYGKS